MMKLNLEFNDNNLDNKGRIFSELSFWNSWKFEIVYPDWKQARYRIYKNNWESISGWAFNQSPIITFSNWLQWVLTSDSWMEIVYQSFNAPEDPILSYKAIDNENWNFYVFYDDNIYPRAEWVKPIDTKISKKELIETLYVWFTKRIIEYYNWTKWYWRWKISETEFLYDFFDKKIDAYLKEQWVDNIDQLVRRAKDIIKSDMPKVLEEKEKQYFKTDD